MRRTSTGGIGRQWTSSIGCAAGAPRCLRSCLLFFFQAEDSIRDKLVTGVQTCALPILGEYVEGCRHRGQPVSQEFLLDALADEFQLGRQVADATAAGATLVRLLDE